MLHIKSLIKFNELLDDFKKDNISYKIYGNSNERFVGLNSSLGLLDKNNTIVINLLALTSIGAIYCHETINFKQTETVELSKAILAKLPIINATLSYNTDNDSITLS